MKLQDKSENQIKRRLQKKVDQLNSSNTFVEFPIHLIYEDDYDDFVQPLEREHKIPEGK